MSMQGDCMQANGNYIMVIMATITGMTLNGGRVSAPDSRGSQGKGGGKSLNN
jgi:hypothetical protein